MHMDAIKKILLFFCPGITLLVLTITGTSFSGETGQELTLIANPSVRISEISRSGLKDIYLGNITTWPNDARIYLTVLKTEIHNHFTKEYLKKTPFQFRAFWRKRLYTGEGQLPETFRSKDELIRFIRSTRGAIGYIDGDLSVKGLKTIRIIRAEEEK